MDIKNHWNDNAQFYKWATHLPLSWRSKQNLQVGDVFKNKHRIQNPHAALRTCWSFFQNTRYFASNVYTRSGGNLDTERPRYISEAGQIPHEQNFKDYCSVYIIFLNTLTVYKKAKKETRLIVQPQMIIGSNW